MDINTYSDFREICKMVLSGNPDKKEIWITDNVAIFHIKLKPTP